MSVALTDWKRVREIPHLDGNALHVWCTQVSEHDSARSHYTAHLSPDELQRASRFRMLKLQKRYIISRGLLRIILSAYLDCSPESVRIAVSLQGKPYLPGTQLQFNLSHSRDAILFAVQRVTPVGVDVEYMRDSVDCVSLAKRFFSAREYQAINNLRGLEQKIAFYTFWTRKEAYLKATGKGLAGLKEAALLEHGVPSAEKGWTLIDLQMPEPGYAGAVAFRGAAALIDTLLLTPDVHGA